MKKEINENTLTDYIEEVAIAIEEAYTYNDWGTVNNISRRMYNDKHNKLPKIIKYFKYDHLPSYLQEISKPFYDIAIDMCSKNLDIEERDIGLRKLLEAKDCMVRGAVR